MSINKLYTFFIAITLCFTVACDGADETIDTDGGATSGTPMGGTPMGGTPMGGTPTGGTPTGGTPMGGTPMGGTPMGGTPMGGTPMGGTPMGGTPMGGMTFPERVGLGDTDALSCDGVYCPSARLSALELPTTRQAATEKGCHLVGKENGATLGSLLMLLGNTNLNDYVNPDDAGNIALLLINHLADWTAGATGNDAGSLNAKFYVGQLVDGETFIDPVSLDETGEPFISFPGTTVTEGLMSTPESSFALSLPILDGFDLAISLESASLEGDVTLDEVGFSLSKGVLGGYLSKDGLASILEGLYVACGLAGNPVPENRPSFCGSIGIFVMGNLETDLASIGDLLKFDTILNDDGLAACTQDREDECNAISLCLLVEMTPVGVRGIAEP